MKHLKSSLSDLRHFFEHTITVREIAEPLVSFDSEQEGSTVRRLMEKRGFDVVGVREEGVIAGYVKRQDLPKTSSAAAGRIWWSWWPRSKPFSSAWRRLQSKPYRSVWSVEQ